MADIKDRTVPSNFNVTLITGGVGGAKLAEGLAALLPPKQLSIIGNIGDDDEFHGLWVSPDVDTLVYTLAGLVDREAGWGVADDSFHALSALTQLGQATWMQLGDRDLATHLYRTEQRRKGRCPAQIARDIARRLGVEHPILLPTSDTVQTRIKTPQSCLSMQEYFVRDRCQPSPLAVEYIGAEEAEANPAALEAIVSADILIFAPSNPLLSIGPTLAISAIRQAIEESHAYRVAVSPLVNNQAIKGPTCMFLQACGYSADLSGIAHFYAPLIDALVVDQQDQTQLPLPSHPELDFYTQNTLMDGRESRISVAGELLHTLSEHLNTKEGKERREPE